MLSRSNVRLQSQLYTQEAHRTSLAAITPVWFSGIVGFRNRRLPSGGAAYLDVSARISKNCLEAVKPHPKEFIDA